MYTSMQAFVEDLTEDQKAVIANLIDEKELQMFAKAMRSECTFCSKRYFVTDSLDVAPHFAEVNGLALHGGREGR